MQRMEKEFSHRRGWRQENGTGTVRERCHDKREIRNKRSREEVSSRLSVFLNG